MSKKAIVLLDESSRTAGVVQNIIDMTDDSAVGFVLPLDKLLWDCGAYPVAIGDRWENGVWSRDGLPVAPVPTTAQRVDGLEQDAKDQTEANVELDYRLSMLELGL